MTAEPVDPVAELLTLCRAARDSGVSFPTIWLDLLKKHPLVLGPPTQEMGDDRPVLSVPLFGGGALLFTYEQVSLG